MSAWAAWAGLALSVIGSIWGGNKDAKIARLREAAAREGALIELSLNSVLRQNLSNYSNGLEDIYDRLEESYAGELQREEENYFARLSLAERSHGLTDEFLTGREALANSVYGDWQEEAQRRWQIATAARQNGRMVAEQFGERALTELQNVRGMLSAQDALRSQEREHAGAQRTTLLGQAGEERTLSNLLLDAEAEDALGDAQLGLSRARAAAQTQDEDRAMALGELGAMHASSGLSVSGPSTRMQRDFAEQRMLRAKQQEQMAIMRQTEKSIQSFALIGFDAASESEHARYMQQVQQLRDSVVEHGAMLAMEDSGGVARANQFIEKVNFQIETGGVRRQQVDLRFRQQVNAIEDNYTRQNFRFDAADIQSQYAAASADLRYQRSLDQQQQIRFNTEQQWRTAANQILAGDQAALRTFEGNMLAIMNQRGANDLGLEEAELQLGAAWAAVQESFNRRAIDLDQRQLSDAYNLGNRFAQLNAADEKAYLQYQTGGIYSIQASAAILSGWTSALASIFNFIEKEQST